VKVRPGESGFRPFGYHTNTPGVQESTYLMVFSMSNTFVDRFSAGATIPPVTLQILFLQLLQIDSDTFREVIRGFVPELESAEVDWYCLAEHPEFAGLVTGDGPAATDVGLITFSGHQVKIVQCNGPMPYGPLKTCVEPALMSREDKLLATEHQSHVLLFEVSENPDPLERHVAVACIAGLFASLGGVTILNEEARAAVPGPDLIPLEDEDLFDTLRSLPIPYLYGGMVRLDVNDPLGLWVRSFANHKLGLPDLAMRVTGPDQVRLAFNMFACITGYIRTMQEELVAGDTADLGDRKIQFRAPHEHEWYLESEGLMLVIEEQA